MRKRNTIFGFPVAALTILLLLSMTDRASAQVCLHYKNHPSGGCGTPCICDDCLICGNGDG